MRWQKISLVSFLAFRIGPAGPEARLYYYMQRGAYNTASLIYALSELGMELEGDDILLVWDNLKAHHSQNMQAFIEESPWLTVEYLPAYSPNLNPDEGVWSSLKGSELANFCAKTVDELCCRARAGLARIAGNQELLWGLARHAGLDITPLSQETTS